MSHKIIATIFALGLAVAANAGSDMVANNEFVANGYFISSDKFIINTNSGFTTFNPLDDAGNAVIGPDGKAVIAYIHTNNPNYNGLLANLLMAISKGKIGVLLEKKDTGMANIGYELLVVGQNSL